MEKALIKIKPRRSELGNLIVGGAMLIILLLIGFAARELWNYPLLPTKYEIGNTGKCAYVTELTEQGTLRHPCGWEQGKKYTTKYITSADYDRLSREAK